MSRFLWFSVYTGATSGTSEVRGAVMVNVVYPEKNHWLSTLVSVSSRAFRSCVFSLPRPLVDRPTPYLLRHHATYVVDQIENAHCTLPFA